MQGQLTPKIPDLKSENHNSSFHFIYLFMPSLNTYLVNAYYVPCTRLGIENTVVREIDSGNRHLVVYNLDSLLSLDCNQTITWIDVKLQL